MTDLPLTKEQIREIGAWAEGEWGSAARETRDLCQQALRAIELEAEKQELAMQALSLSGELAALQSELTATRNALEEERERCAGVVDEQALLLDASALSMDAKPRRDHRDDIDYSRMADSFKREAGALRKLSSKLRALQAPQVKP